MATLDERYPNLSSLVRSVLNRNLEELASRAPADQYEFYDLERLLADTRQNDIPAIAESPFAPFAAQTRGYLATIEEYIARNLVKNPRRFIRDKLAAPKTPRELRGGSEALDTIAECSWGLWLHEQYGNLEEERALPGGVGDADFYVVTPQGDLWVDCLAVAPTSERHELATYLSDMVTDKWRTKFGLRCGNDVISTGICVSLLKRQENVIGALRFAQDTGEGLKVSDSVWLECPGLQSVWIGLPPWHERPHRPEIVGEWQRA